ncbi:plasmid replication protein RepC [Botrimarina mediterranea]|uniref:plasmid replication protein RepC n=1 Tax=Botrimarina mediterranea TaxID=2528022 RepID=UPI001187D22B|nr:hypothetical protein K2D_26980 [Planctomycetes bacterium K2D]
MSTDTLIDSHSIPARPPGGRVASDAYRHARRLADDFTGLEQGADRYALLLLVKRVGKLAGFTPRMITLLDYYLAFSRDLDWEEGSRPIVYQSLSKTALDLGVSERMVQKLEAALFAAGAIGWNDSGNHKRFGQRCPRTGRLLWAFGVDLTPLAYLREELEAKLQEKRRHDDDWMATKRRISALRRDIRAHLAEWSQTPGNGAGLYAARYEAIAVQLRTHLDLAAMHTLLAEHEALLAELVAAMPIAATDNDVPLLKKTDKSSCTGATGFVHYKSTTQSSNPLSRAEPAGLQKSVAAGPEGAGETTGVRPASTGIEHVSLGMALAVAGPAVRASLPIGEPDWGRLVEAAYASRGALGISQASWAEACETLGRVGAALCLVLTERAAIREQSPAERPAAYFRGLVRRGASGELRLHSSVFAWLERDGADS